MRNILISLLLLFCAAATFAQQPKPNPHVSSFVAASSATSDPIGAQASRLQR